jgi:hypothetical protein
MIKIKAIEMVMTAHGGSATMEQIYNEAKTHLPDVDKSPHWKAGLRGVLYREIRNNKTFKKVQAATYGLI